MRSGSSTASKDQSNIFDLSSERFGGLIKEPLYEQVFDNCKKLQSYFDVVVPMYPMLCKIISMFRILQLWGASICENSETIYEKGSTDSTVVSIFSMIYHLLPVSVRGEIFISIYIAFFVIYGLFFLISSFIYEKTSEISTGIAKAVNMIYITAFILIQPCAMAASGKVFGDCIFNDQSNAAGISLSVIAFLCMLVSYGFHFFIYTDTLLFRPESLATVRGKYQSTIYLITCLITFLTSLSAYAEKIPRIVILGICVVIYIFSLYWTVRGASYYDSLYMSCVTTAAIAGACDLLIIIVLSILGYYGNLYLLFSAIIIFPLVYFIVKLVLERRFTRHLIILDEFTENGTFEFNSPDQFLSIIVSGYMYGHNCCIRYDLFHQALEQFPDNYEILYCYAKFAAIFPEDNLNVKEVLASIKGEEKYKDLLMHLMRLLKQRERGLAASLKKKINSISKKIENVKRKLHSVWDYAIQGNIVDMGPAVNNAYEAAEKCATEITHVTQEYPNNKHAMRIEARFLNEIRGDKEAFLQCKDRITSLGRGINVNVDIYKEAGLLSFPLLPTTKEEYNQYGPSQSVESDVNQQDLDTETDEVTQAAFQQSITLMNQINEVRIPSLHYLTIMMVIILIILGILPTILFNVCNNIYVTSITEPLEYISSISHMRCVNFQLAAFGTRYVLEGLPALIEQDTGAWLLREPNYFRYYKPSSLGDSLKTNDQIKAILKEVSSVIEGTEQIRNFETDNEDMNNVRKQIFSPTIKFSFSTNISYKTYEMRNSQDVFIDTANQAARLTNMTIVRDSLNDPAYLNLIDNAMNFGNNMNVALELFTEYVKNKDNKIHLIFNIVLIAEIIIILLLCIIYDVIAYRSILSDQTEVFKCLTTLPKAVVSNAAEAQKTIEKDSSASITAGNESNRQEENILRVFSNAGDSIGSTGSFIIILSTVFIFCLIAIAFWVFIKLYKDQSTLFADSSPHADYIYGCAGYMNGVFLALNGIILSNNAYPEVHPDVYYLLERLDQRMDIVRDYYQSFRYGKPEIGQTPYSGFDEEATRMKEIIGCNVTDYQTTGERIMCSSADEQLILFDILTYQLAQNFRDNISNISAHNDLVSDLWAVGPVGLYDSLFSRMFENLINNIKSNISSETNISTIYASICVIGIFLFVIINIVELQKLKNRLMFTLKLLLHCDKNAVFSSSKIQAVLSNNFTTYKGDSSLHDEEYFTHIVEKLTDACMWSSQDGRILYANQACQRIFGKSKEEIVGITVTDFFNDSHFKGAVQYSHDSKAKTDSHVQYVTEKGTTYLQVTITPIKEISIITCIDETQRINYNTLIEEESNKSDILLSSILPPSLVKRVKEGETNISFAVQSASVLFLDIVSFTPWCGSNSASYVMMVLNRLYKELDSVMHTYPSMTKVKCIGDCYMAAGGIFTEVNQPSQHAKEAVEFGLAAIQTVVMLDKELNEKLQIRVGINTGGPIVAGVLGSGKPTFEILGPAINMAQQMEHHGVPMKVHISRPVYELIYGGSFNIKEKGETEIKNGTIMTYLVEEPTAK